MLCYFCFRKNFHGSCKKGDDVTGKRVYSLDVLRLIGTVLIILHHYQQITDSYFTGYAAVRRLSIVVEFFFVLSGFLAYKYAEGNKLNFRKFLVGKWIRLIPMVILTSIAYEILLYFYNIICRTEWILGNA